jgi:hypothetical protein
VGAVEAPTIRRSQHESDYDLIGRAIGVFVDRKEIGEPGESPSSRMTSWKREFAREAGQLGLPRERTVARMRRRSPHRSRSRQRGTDRESRI